MAKNVSYIYWNKWGWISFICTKLIQQYKTQNIIVCFFWTFLLQMKLGLWIDLTNTNRFYDKSEVEAAKCRYIKVPCRGYGKTPSEDQTKFFIKVIHQFISQSPLDMIVVHCTHGFNRTGFLIVSYLVEVEDNSLGIALQTFSKLR